MKLYRFRRVTACDEVGWCLVRTRSALYAQKIHLSNRVFRWKLVQFAQKAVTATVESVGETVFYACRSPTGNLTIQTPFPVRHRRLNDNFSETVSLFGTKKDRIFQNWMEKRPCGFFPETLCNQPKAPFRPPPNRIDIR